MQYSARELRNTHRPLLRRLQRRVDVANELKQNDRVKELKIKKDKEDKLIKSLVKGNQIDFVQEDEDFGILKQPKTKLHLYDRRRGR